MDTYEGSRLKPISLHRYIYCSADPITRLDPSGHIGELAMGLEIQVVLTGFLHIPINAILDRVLPWKTVALDVVNYYNSDISEAQVQNYIREANSIFARARIKFVQDKPTEQCDYDKAFAHGGLYPHNFGRDSGNRVIPGDNISTITQGENTDHLTAYFANRFDPEGQPHTAGMAFAFGRFPSPPAPSVFVTQGAVPEALAHEAGHVLFEEEDVAGTDYANLMFNQGWRHQTAIMLSDSQIKKARSHILAK